MESWHALNLSLIRIYRLSARRHCRIQSGHGPVVENCLGVGSRYVRAQPEREADCSFRMVDGRCDRPAIRDCRELHLSRAPTSAFSSSLLMPISGDPSPTLDRGVPMLGQALVPDLLPHREAQVGRFSPSRPSRRESKRRGAAHRIASAGLASAQQKCMILYVASRVLAVVCGAETPPMQPRSARASQARADCLAESLDEGLMTSDV